MRLLLTPALVVALMVGPALRAQNGVPAPDLPTLQGQVFNAATGEPVRNASLSLRRVDATNRMAGAANRSINYTTTTDASGQFAMKDLAPGNYRLVATASGFVTGEYGARGPGRPGTTIAIDQSHSLNDLIVKLTPTGVITGRVLDHEGNPVANVRMELARFRYTQGQKKLSSSDFAYTNDLGEYRVFGVAPGRYYLAAVFPQNLANAGIDRSVKPPVSEDYVPEFYPGTPDIAAALQLEVTPGAEIRNQELILRKERTAKISGNVVNGVAQAATPTVVNLIARGSTAGLFSARTAQLDAEGKFELRGVPPGSYYLTASASQNGRTPTARQAIEVNGEDIDNLTVNIGPGFQIVGRVHAENDAPFNQARIRILFRSLSPGGLAFGVGLKEDGRFSLDGVNSDNYDVAVSGLPDGFYIKSARIGQTDVLISGLDTTNGPPGELDVLVSPNAAQLNGSVQSPKNQQLVPGASIVLIPDAPDRREQPAFYRGITSDQTGHFTLKNVTPGNYTIYAWEDVEPGAYFDPDFLKSYETWGAKAEVSEGAQLSLQLTLIPAQ